MYMNIPAATVNSQDLLDSSVLILTAIKKPMIAVQAEKRLKNAAQQ